MFNKKRTKVDISAPTNFQHRVHTGYDFRTQRFVGLPKQWTNLVSDKPNYSTVRRSRTQPNILSPANVSNLQFFEKNVTFKIHNL